ncbi:MAG: class I SAM-dependent methyltransferase, partial [Coriobacteriales bacterium]|nr:class I SAM-dependent methyltransferase [Coriobacteriales bacterium]
DVEQFENRLSKMAAHRAKWARRSGVSCYRVYDADLPSFAVALDVYEGAGPNEGNKWLHIAEYAPPKHIDEALAMQRLSTVLSVAPRILDVPLANVYLKTRRRAKGGSQYASPETEASKEPTTKIVGENGLLFEVDFSSHLDTGIFLDHRLTRALLREKATGLDTLNLFAYTGTASVYMAAGGASTVTTVDMSNTYLATAERNMRRNGFKGESYPFVQADVLRWVADHRHDKQKYGLIFCDPPTFSNSSSMGSRTWDVQRDHAELLIALSRMLTPDGVVVFSTNLRSFTPEMEPLQRAGVTLKDITAQTIPQDFERNQKIHHCYLVQRVRPVTSKKPASSSTKPMAKNNRSAPRTTKPLTKSNRSAPKMGK